MPDLLMYALVQLRLTSGKALMITPVIISIWLSTTTKSLALSPTFAIRIVRMTVTTTMIPARPNPIEMAIASERFQWKLFCERHRV
jgi:hypothetical protein